MLSGMEEKIIHFVETTASEQRVLLCRWVERFYEQGRRVQVICDSTPSAQLLDQVLWTFAQASFVPHSVYRGEEGELSGEPVLIVTEQVRLSGFDAVVCDCAVGLDFMADFEAGVHFVIRDDPERRNASRVLWQNLRDRGIAVRHVAYGSAA